MGIEGLKRHKSPGIDKIPAQLIKKGNKAIRYGSINFLIVIGIR
jgi:hypothetical protein